MQLFILVSIILGAFAINIQRTEKRKKVTVNSKAKTKGDWYLSENHEYTVYVYVGSQSNYSTCKFKADVVYPWNNVAADKKKGWQFSCPTANQDLQNVMDSVGNNTWQLDYRNCSAFSSSSNYSVWGEKGKTISTTYRNKSGQDVSVVIMFQYGYTGDYITSSELPTLRDHINALKTNRNSNLIKLKSTCNSAAAELESANATVNTLSQPVTSMDASIAKSTADKTALESSKVAKETEISEFETQIADLQKQLAAKIAGLSAAGIARNEILSNIELKTAEINDYNKSKTSAQGERDAQLATAKQAVSDAKTKYTGCSGTLLVACTVCTDAVGKANIAFAAVPFAQTPVVNFINSIYVSAA